MAAALSWAGAAVAESCEPGEVVPGSAAEWEAPAQAVSDVAMAILWRARRRQSWFMREVGPVGRTAFERVGGAF